MKPVGTILQTARQTAGFSIEDISKRTRIRKKYLEYIENNEWEKLPGVAYIRGFIKSYAEAVELVPDKMVTLFRREYIDVEKRTVLPDSFVDMPARRKSLWLTITSFLSKLVS